MDFKIGDGIHAWLDLPYVQFGEIPNNGTLKIEVIDNYMTSTISSKIYVSNEKTYEIDKNDPNYVIANRLIKYLKYFKDISDDTAIPCNSLIREFIGGSCFKV